MMEVRKSGFLQAIPLLITICFLSFPVYAKYSGGTGEPNDPYQIATAEDLMLLGESIEDYNKHFVLTTDIDLDPNLPGRKVFDKSVIAAPTSFDEWGGLLGTYFTGVFDGDGHTISNLKIEGESYLGLFGLLELEGEVKNLSLVNVDIKSIGGFFVGGLVGSCGVLYTRSGGVITNCNSTGSISGKGGVGGLVGFSSCSMTDCYSTSNVHGTELVGGLVGRMGGGNVTRCYSTSVVNGEGSVGGLVGYKEGGYVTDCKSGGTVSGDRLVGGLVGSTQSGKISRSFNTSSVSGTELVGGLLGSNRGGGVYCCYSNGIVTGTESVGGLVGYNGPEIDGGRGILNNCYSTSFVSGGGLVGSNSGYVFLSVWDIETSGVSGGSDGVGLTTAEMTDPYMLGLNGFANDPNWVLNAGQDYPRLAWEGTKGNPIPEPNIDWMEGNGTQEYPYTIKEADQLILLGKASILWDKHFILAADINLDPNLPNGRIFEKAVFPDFWGVFDGNGHIISHLTIEGGHNLGLFGRLYYEAEVKNLGLGDVNITGSGGSVGAVVGWNSDSSKVINCYSTGLVSGSCDVGGLVGNNSTRFWDQILIIKCYSTCRVKGNDNVGGLVGINLDGRIAMSYSTGSVSGESDVGGLVGYNGGSDVTNCYSTGMVSGSGDYVGGLVGYNGSKVTDCYSTGLVIGVTGGGLLGYNSGRVTNSFWNIYTSNQVTSAGGTYKTTAKMQRASTFINAGWDFVDETENGTEDIWCILEGRDYPRLVWEQRSIDVIPEPNIDWLEGSGTAGDPYRIDTAEQLILLGQTSILWDKHIILTSDIDLDPNLLNGQVFEQSLIPSFIGVFDGAGNTISNLTIEGEDYLGLFGQLIQGAEVRNIGLVDVNIIGSGDYVGGLVGYNNSVIITDCYCTGIVLANDYVGGLVGYNNSVIVTDCYSSGTVLANDYVGGLVGSNNSILRNCYSTVKVTGDSSVGGLVGSNNGDVTSCSSTGSVSGRDEVGGLVGKNYEGRVTECYSTTDVSGTNNIGGLIGNNIGERYESSLVFQSYSTGTVTGNSHLGGLVGYNGLSGTLLQCYSTSSVSGIDYVGGLVGENNFFVSQCYSSGAVSGDSFIGGLVGNNSYVRNSPAVSFWDIETSGQSSSDGGTGKTTTEMQAASTFRDDGWDFVDETENGTDDIWWIDEGNGYPRLWWEHSNNETLVLVVDDFESYNDLDPGSPGSYLIYLAWILPPIPAHVTNGAIMGHVSPFGDPVLSKSSIETVIVRGGDQSGPLQYNNTGAYLFSEVWLTFLGAQDWTANGATRLSLWFYGDPTNTPGQLYLKINDFRIDYDGDPDNLTRPQWHRWNIDLASVDTNLQSVTSIAIGVDGLGAKGTLLIDEIGLYASGP